MTGNSLDQNAVSPVEASDLQFRPRPPLLMIHIQINAREALRNSVMDHAHNADTFQDHYLSRFITVHLMAAHRGLNRETAPMAQLTGRGQSVSSHWPHSLRPADVEALKRKTKHNMCLASQLSGIPQQSAKYREIQSRRRAHLDRICNIRLQGIRKKWSDEQGVGKIAWHVRSKQSPPLDPDNGVLDGGFNREQLDLLKAPLTNEYTTDL